LGGAVTQALAGFNMRASLADPAGGLLVGRIGTVPWVIVADPDLLDNQAMATPERARRAAGIIEGLRGGGPVRFDVALNGLGGERSVLRTALQPPFLAATLCLVAACLLMGWHGLVRFGPVRGGPAPVYGKAALADNAAALVARTGRAPRLGGADVRLVRDQVARAIGAPHALTGPALEDFLARAGAARGASEGIAELTRDAQVVRDVPALLALAARVYGYRAAMIHGRR
jgi:hypothetical protein